VPGSPKQELSDKNREITVTLQPGESKEVVLEVQNAWKSVARESIPLQRANVGKKSTVIEVGGTR
jgi:hypothetical protein